MMKQLARPAAREQAAALATDAAARMPAPGRLMVSGRVAAAKVGCSYRHWLRLCDDGLAPPGKKLGALRRWDLDELDRWIAAGNPPVRKAAAR